MNGLHLDEALVTSCGLNGQGSNPGENEIFCAHPECPPSQGQSSWSSALNYPPSSIAKFKGRVNLYLYVLLCAFVACYTVLCRDLLIILLIHVKKLNVLSDYTTVTPKVNTDCVLLHLILL